MPYVLKPNKLFAKDENSTAFLPQNVVSDTTTMEDLESIRENLSETVSKAQTAVNSIDAKSEEMIARIASVAGQGTDTTLSQSAVAADAKAAGDAIGDLKSAVSASTSSFLFYKQPSITWYQGGFKRDGSNTSSEAYIKTNFLIFANSVLCKFHPSSTFGRLYIAEYTQASAGSFVRLVVSDTNVSGDFVFALTEGHYYRFMVGIDGAATVSPTDEAVSENEIYTVLKGNVFAEIAAEDDLDDYVTEGIYLCRSTSVTETLKHCPLSNTGFDLRVTTNDTTRAHGIYVRQILMRNGADSRAVIYVRFKASAEWTDWDKIALDKEALKIVDSIQIESGDDLDTYVTPGHYSSQDTAVTSSLLNCPLTSTGFEMIVIRTSGHGDGTYVRQILMRNGTEEAVWYTRYKGSAEWGSWFRVNIQTTLGSSKMRYIRTDYSILPSNRNLPAKQTITVGSFNVAHYNHDTQVYLDQKPEFLLNIRRFIAENELDILFLQESSETIDNDSKSAWDYLYKTYFNKWPVYDGEDACNPTPRPRKILTRLDIDTDGTMSSVANLYPSTTNRPYAYYAWCVCNLEGVGNILLIDAHNFYNGSKDSYNQWKPFENRVNYLTKLGEFVQSKTYDYCIIAGDFNSNNSLGNDADGNRIPMEYDGDHEAIINFCNNNGMTPCNGGPFGWFSTHEGGNALDNILVSNNIRIESVKCNRDVSYELYSDHAPIIVKLSFL